jgi:glycerate kinase
LIAIVRILIAPDKFKGSLNAREVAENIAKGLGDTLPNVRIDIVPMADGGEGTAEAICDSLGCSWAKCRAHDPIGREIDARYGWLDQRKLAIMEMSEAAGMRRLSESERDPVCATTFGVGEMILDAGKRDAQEIIIGLGGSATNDGGFGMARALGYGFFASISMGEYLTARLRGEKPSIPELTGPVTELRMLERVEKPKDLSLPRIIAAADVRNPLLGENGATQIFGPQKGATPEQIRELELALSRLADILPETIGSDHTDTVKPGAGAAGGLGFGLMSFCGARIRPGFDVVADAVGLESKMKEVDVVVTGEGSLDRQTLEGKTPAGVARLARTLGKKVFAIAGRYDGNRQVRELFDEVYQLARSDMSEKEQMKRAGELLREKAHEMAKAL